MGDRTRGLYRKFIVTRRDGSSLRGENDPFAKAAILAYAEACELEYPLLAADLRAKFPTGDH